jgi:hypothetical protein
MAPRADFGFCSFFSGIPTKEASPEVANSEQVAAAIDQVRTLQHGASVAPSQTTLTDGSQQQHHNENYPVGAVRSSSVMHAH